MEKLVRLLLFTLAFLAACKKTEDPLKQAPPKTKSLASTESIISTNKPLTVVTIAGMAYENGSLDGVGSQARFSYPNGIDILDDGSICIADEFADQIRKITQPNIVTTLHIPASSDGRTLSSPARVRVLKDGTINILAADAFSLPEHKTWIIKPGGEVSTPPNKPAKTPVVYSPYSYYDLEKDPYYNYSWISGVYDDHVERYLILEKFLIGKSGYIGTSGIRLPSDSLDIEGRDYAAITSFFCGYNGVKYLVINGNSIYKYTSSGVFTRIFRDLKFHGITSIAANRDSRTIYLVDDGAIKRIVNRKLQYMVGPHAPFNRRDGVGSNADVYANQLALSKDESTLYFTDENTVRKVILR